MSIIFALWSFATSPFGRLVVVGFAALSFGFFQGYELKAKFDRSATLSAIITKQRIDLEAAQSAAADAQKTATELAAIDAKNQEIIRGLQGNSCKLDDAGARRLHGIQ